MNPEPPVNPPRANPPPNPPNPPPNPGNNRGNNNRRGAPNPADGGGNDPNDPNDPDYISRFLKRQAEEYAIDAAVKEKLAAENALLEKKNKKKKDKKTEETPKETPKETTKMPSKSPPKQRKAMDPHEIYSRTLKYKD